MQNKRNNYNNLPFSGSGIDANAGDELLRKKEKLIARLSGGHLLLEFFNNIIVSLY